MIAAEQAAAGAKRNLAIKEEEEERVERGIARIG